MSKKWKEYKFILYESSLLTWYADIKHKKPDGMVLLKVKHRDEICFFTFFLDLYRMSNNISAWVHIQGLIEKRQSMDYNTLKISFRFLPDFPQLENEYDQVALIAFPQSIKDRERNIIWLLCEDVHDLKYKFLFQKKNHNKFQLLI